MLEILGVSPAEELVYTTLLDGPPLTTRQLARACSSSAGVDVDAVLESLEAKGMAYRLTDDPARFAPTSPEVALENLQVAREEAIRRSRTAISDLSERYLRMPRNTSAPEAVELVVGEAAVANRFDLALRSVRRDCRVLDCPPYRLPCDVPETERRMLADGVRVRVVYDQSAVDALGIEQLRTAVGLGEQARLVGQLRLRLYLVDDRLALVPLKAGQSPHEGLLVVRQSALLDALIELFELTWMRAVPLVVEAEPTDAGTEPSGARSSDPGEDALLGLLAAGLADAAIARQLGLSLRTVERRVSRVMGRLNAKSRFQAGVMLGRQGRYDVGPATVAGS